MWVNIVLVFISYFIGNISFSYVLTRIKLKEDIREFGSGNAGTTNVLRVLGKKYAIMVLAGDMLKGICAITIGILFTTNDLFLVMCGLAVILGHNWPVLMGFRGGKGIATSIGVFIIYDPIIALVCLSFGISIILISRYVSLGSILGMAVLPIIVVLFGRIPEELILSIFISLITIYRHRSNISRLINRNESKLKL